jgi:hypothetical protein
LGFDVSLARPGISLSSTANTYENRIGVRVYFNNKVADAALTQLEGQCADIEKAIGEPLLWNPYPGKRDKIISITREADLARREKWPDYLSWDDPEDPAVSGGVCTSPQDARSE